MALIKQKISLPLTQGLETKLDDKQEQPGNLEVLENAVFDELDCFISLPKAKQHVSAGVTHAMKNLVGTLPRAMYSSNGSNRNKIHSHNDRLDKNSNSNLLPH